MHGEWISISGYWSIRRKKKKTAEEWHVFIAPRLAGQEPEHPDKEAKDNE